MRSYAKRFSNINSHVYYPIKKVAIQGFRVNIYDYHINLIKGSKGIKFFTCCWRRLNTLLTPRRQERLSILVPCNDLKSKMRGAKEVRKTETKEGITSAKGLLMVLLPTSNRPRAQGRQSLTIRGNRIISVKPWEYITPLSLHWTPLRRRFWMPLVVAISLISHHRPIARTAEVTRTETMNSTGTISIPSMRAKTWKMNSKGPRETVK